MTIFLRRKIWAYRSNLSPQPLHQITRTRYQNSARKISFLLVLFPFKCDHSDKIENNSADESTLPSASTSDKSEKKYFLVCFDIWQTPTQPKSKIFKQTGTPSSALSPNNSEKNTSRSASTSADPNVNYQHKYTNFRTRYNIDKSVAWVYMVKRIYGRVREVW